MRRRKELLVGSVVLLGIAVAIYGTFWLQGRRFGSIETEVHVLMRDAGQLSNGNAVTFRGVNIGRVGDITVEDSGAAVRIQLLLDGDWILDDDAVVVLAPASMFGDWQAEIVTRSRFPQYDYSEVPSDAQLTEGVRVLGGYVLPDLSRLTAVADEVAQNVASLTDRFDRAFGQETADQITQAIDNMEEFTAPFDGLPTSNRISFWGSQTTYRMLRPRSHRFWRRPVGRWRGSMRCWLPETWIRSS